MIQLHTWVMGDCTLGRLYYGLGDEPFECFTVELPWRHNKVDVSCIPAMIYEYRKIYSPSAERYVLRLFDVPDRTLINVESANKVKQLLGCIAVGSSIVYMDNDYVPDVANSGKTLDNLLSIVPDRGKINITRVGFYV